MGADGPNDPYLDQISPAQHADKAAIPILLIDGRAGGDVHGIPSATDQTQLMAEALRKAGRPAALAILNEGEPWRSHPNPRLQMLTATVDFLEKNNPPN